MYNIQMQQDRAQLGCVIRMIRVSAYVMYAYATVPKHSYKNMYFQFLFQEYQFPDRINEKQFLFSAGKCYNVAEDFFPRRRKPKTEQSKTKKVGREDEAQLRRMQKEFDSEQEKSHFVNIPPHFPHEGKAMLIRDMRNIDLEEAAATTTTTTPSSPPPKSPRKEEKKQPELDEHFFYGNVPVLEYQLSDGSGGTVKQTPRR